MDSAATTSHYEDQWELRNDDGFVYKLKKRRIDPSASQPPPPSTDAGGAAAAEEEAVLRRRERKKRNLLKLKAKYESEILQWDNLSNSLCAMEERAIELQQEREVMHSLASSSEVEKAVDRVGETLLDELLSQVEGQEAIIHDCSNICDVAEALCLKKEEQFKQSLFNLPVWASPRELMKSLCDD
ncbi:hypothetical protein TanjilG_20983 [Lupinus angustifolius]|uniref:Uncharacterized protein n=1 Tax=Lupinus angustifolius TaxID=3871 RepID=A0A1J7HSG1_LUPAN|nr:PREDICTED: uncharacterized protein LOC109350664 [Lupinus angustifolius]OIW09386.1 hypothetical protein TanjilG_20983 [Lupinus angustifolius]